MKYLKLMIITPKLQPFFEHTGNGLVRLFRERNGKENVVDEQTPNVKKNKIPSPSMFASSKQGTAVVQGIAVLFY